MGKNLSHWAIQICQNQGSIPSPLSRKNTIFAIFGQFLPGNRAESKIKGLESKFYKMLYICISMLVPTFSSFAAIQRSFQKRFKQFAESIGTNFKSQKWKSKTLVCPFHISLFHFETNLIKAFSFFPDHFGQLGNFFHVGLKQKN